MVESRMHRVARELADEAALVKRRLSESGKLADIYNSMCKTLDWLNELLEEELGEGDKATSEKGPIDVSWKPVDIEAATPLGATR